MYKAALVDIDGFLINSEHLYLEANKIYFKQFNFDFTEEMHRQGTGKKFNKWITTVFPTDKTGEEILKERNIIFFDLARKKLELLDGAEELLTMLHDNFKTALVTSTERGYCPVPAPSGSLFARMPKYGDRTDLRDFPRGRRTPPK